MKPTRWSLERSPRALRSIEGGAELGRGAAATCEGQEIPPRSFSISTKPTKEKPFPVQTIQGKALVNTHCKLGKEKGDWGSYSWRKGKITQWAHNYHQGRAGELRGLYPKTQGPHTHLRLSLTQNKEPAPHHYHTCPSQKLQVGSSLVVHWLGLHAPTAKGTGSIPGRGAKIPQATRHGQKKKKKTYKKVQVGLPWCCSG